MANWIDELATEALAGNQDAWKELVHALTPRLWAHFRKRGVADPEREDLVQETWVRVIRYRERFDETRQFEPYIFTIAKHVACDWHRRRKPPSSLAVEDEPVSNQPPLEVAFERDELVWKALETLTDKQRTILKKRFWDGMTIKQIAIERGASVSSIRGKSYRAIQDLLEELIKLVEPCEIGGQ